eukprot:Opistho-1_new@88121
MNRKNLLKLLFAGQVLFSFSVNAQVKMSGNPIVKDKFTADPAALVDNGTVYIYAGHDEAPTREQRYVMNEWLCYSSTDMVNWKEHPSPLNTKNFTWAKGDAWASQVKKKKKKKKKKVLCVDT